MSAAAATQRATPARGNAAASAGRAAARRTVAAPLSAFVLHQYAWSESSLILELFTRERGRLAVAARGAKRPYSQLRPVLLPFQRLTVTLGREPLEAQAEVQTLRSVEWAGGLPMPGGAALFPGFYLNELLLKLLARQDAHPALFDAYAQTVPALAHRDDGHVHTVLRAFELTLLREIGLLPDLSCVTATQQPLHAAGLYSALPDSGVVAVSSPEGLNGQQLVALQAALDHGSTQALHGACQRAMPALRGMLRNLLHYHLGSTRLRTRQVMADVQKLVDTAS